MKQLAFAWLALLLFAAVSRTETTPTPAPYTISDAEVSKLSKEDIAKTAHHLVQMYQDEHKIRLDLQWNLDDATSKINIAVGNTTSGLTHVDSLQSGIDQLAKHDQAETDRANKLDKAVWWYRLHWWGAWIMLGLGIAMCVLFAILKATGKISFNAAQIASKIPI